MSRRLLVVQLAEAWLTDAHRIVRAVGRGLRRGAVFGLLALFRPSAVEQARREYATAMRQAERWTA